MLVSIQEKDQYLQKRFLKIIALIIWGESSKISSTKQKMVSLYSLDSGSAFILDCPEKESWLRIELRSQRQKFKPYELDWVIIMEISILIWMNFRLGCSSYFSILIGISTQINSLNILSLYIDFKYLGKIGQPALVSFA